MRQYLDLCKYILDHGEKKEDRTGTGTLSVFGQQTKYDLRDGFPIVTTKKILFAAVVRELLWFLKGATNINDGLKEFTPIWNAWASESGELGPIYGYQWRKWEKFVKDGEGYRKEYVDQITEVIAQIKKNPNSRRHIVSAWNVADIERMALPPCHTFFQFYVCNGRLDCQLYQRSADVALGVPFNISSYALLMSMVAMECDLTPGIFVHTLGDAHIYLNHVEGIKTQLPRTCKPLPRLKLAKKKVLDFTFEDIELLDYQHDAFIKFPIAV
ncbi:MAG: thymidylate synthase [Candidatus Omnitrophica bacterium]|nr:thymidylate synthase [Candidatus Omnitrophota bacterium]